MPGDPTMPASLRCRTLALALLYQAATQPDATAEVLANSGQ